MRFSLSTILLTLSLFCFGQTETIREEVFVHTNSNYLLSGETMYYAAYVNQMDAGTPSELSALVYVELIGAENQRVFQHKLKLRSGKAHGEFFVPTLISTGTYQLVAYTRWMKNFDSYFSMPVTIINPFEEYDIPSSTGITVSFMNERVVANQPNDLKASITKDGKPLEITGRIVDETGSKVADFTSDKFGLASFTLIPEEGSNYQLIVENDQKEFEFINLPLAFVPSGISITEYPGFFQMILMSENDPNGVLQIYNGTKKILEQEHPTNEAFRISKDLLPGDGPYLATFGNSSQVFSTASPQNAPTSTGTFATRSKVSVPINISGRFSVSVAPTNETNLPTSKETGLYNRTSQTGQVLNWRGVAKLPSEVSHLPEIRGEIISAQTSKTHAGQTVLFSTIDTTYQLRTASVSKTGKIDIQIEAMYADKDAYLSLLDSDSTFSVEIEDPFITQYNDLTFPEVILDSAKAEELAERSVNNQIENAYYRPPGNSITQPILPYQFGEFDKKYELDEFNRFPEMNAHFVEYIPEVVARQNKNRSKLRVLPKHLLATDLPPLILIDGLPTTPEKILSFSPYKIKRIAIDQNRLFLGSLVADGLVSFETFTGDLYGYQPDANSVAFSYQHVEPTRNYAFPNYEELKTTSPDYRSTLYWNPNLRVNGNVQLEFYTSDLEGDYVISIEGFSDDGQPVSIRRTFTVVTSSPTSN